MTTNAEAAAVAGIVGAHGQKAINAGVLPSDGPTMAQCAAILTQIGAGTITQNSIGSATYTSFATAVGRAYTRALANGDAPTAVTLRTAQQILINLAAGV